MAANVTLPDDLLAQAQRVTRNGETADDLAAAAVKKEVARRLLAQIKSEARVNRRNMTDKQVQEYVDQVIHEYRAENRER